MRFINAEDIAAFYHTSVTDDDRHLKIIQSQINYMNSTGLLKKLNAVYYGVIHPPTVAHKKKLKISNEKFVNIGYWYKGQEMKTLSVLYSFCKSNPGYKVLYFHMKGGSNSLLRNLQARQTLDAFTLNPACITALDSYEICGWRFSPVPYMHYSGNYWWARCTYINKLVDPKLMTMESPKQTYAISEMLKYYSQEEQKQDFMKAKMRMEICVGLGRFFGEAWIGSATYVNAADCMPDNADKNFIMYGEYVPPFLPLAEQYTSKKLQMVCGKAAANRSIESARAFQIPFQESLKSHPCSVVTTGIRRGMLFFNETPHSLIQWRSLMGENMTAVSSVLAEYHK